MSSQHFDRKFLPKTLPALSRLPTEEQERYYLYSDGVVDLRVQKINDRHEIERLALIGINSRDKQKMAISANEFTVLKQIAAAKILRTNYIFSEKPYISIKVYHGRFKGLARIEVAFNNENEAKKFTPPNWFGAEISGTPLWRDSELLNLSKNEFIRLLTNYSH